MPLELLMVPDVSVQPGRYGPATMVSSKRRQVLGLTDIDAFTICTSAVALLSLTSPRRNV